MNSKNIVVTALVLIFAVVLFGLSDIDIIVQDYFFNAQTQQWILEGSKEPYKFIFYDGIKKVLILFAALLLIALLFFRKKKIVQEYRKGIIIVLLSAALVPLFVGGLKKYTNMPCPKNEIRYGGNYPKTAVWERYPETFKPECSIKCWPAGHASGGFALLSLFFLFKTRSAKMLSVVFAMATGWSMGIYKMVIGDHFFSHTVITMLLAWLIVLIIAKIVQGKESAP